MKTEQLISRLAIAALSLASIVGLSTPAQAAQDQLVLELDLSLAYDGTDRVFEFAFSGDTSSLTVDWDDGAGPVAFTSSKNYAGTSGTKTVVVSSSNQDIRLTWGAGPQSPNTGPVFKEGFELVTDVLELPIWIDKYQAALAGAINLESVPSDLPVETVGDVTRPVATDLSWMFGGANVPGGVSGWDTSRVTDMRGTFGYSKSNPDVSGWDTSSVTDMAYMFHGDPWEGGSTFNADIGAWDTSSVTDMSYMFAYQPIFNQEINHDSINGYWDTSSVTDMSFMFYKANTFNQPIGDWDVSSVTDMQNMFDQASVFDQPIANWNVSSVETMREMFWEAFAFNQPIGDWDVSSVTNMEAMFYDANSFNQPIGDWDVSSVTDMQEMFEFADSFNQPIGDWDVSSVTDMQEMFQDALEFNQSLAGWDVSSVSDMGEMFENATAFNQPIGQWDVSSVELMEEMFAGATVFNSYIGSWDTAAATDMTDMFSGSGFTYCLPDTFFISGEGYSEVALLIDESTCVSYTNGSAAQRPYRGPVIQDLTTDFASTREVTVTGLRLDGFNRVSVNGVALPQRLDSDGNLYFDTTSLNLGEHRIEFYAPQYGTQVRIITVLDPSNLDSPADSIVDSELELDAQAPCGAVNAGTFKGYVAVYAKSCEGHRLSAKVGKDWIIIPVIPSAPNDLFRFVEKTGPGVNVAVQIFIDRLRVKIVDLTTE